MPKGLQKSLQFYISKVKRQNQQSPNDPPHYPISRRLLSACSCPKTPSFSSARNNAATLTDIDRFLFENFSSLYADEGDERPTKNVSGSDSTIYDKKTEGNGDRCDRSVILADSPRFVKTPPSLRSLHRFFVPLGTSNSLIEEARSYSSSCSTSDDMAHFPSDDFTAVITHTRDPYDDFRRSMIEMLGARELGKYQPLDWDYLEDLLFCYLNLNERKTHKYILGAFVDLMASFQQESVKAPKSVRRTAERKVLQRNDDIIFLRDADWEFS